MDLVLVKGFSSTSTGGVTAGVRQVGGRKWEIPAGGGVLQSGAGGHSYRGHTDRLFKRDFAGEIMDRHPKMELVDYGFAYRRDPNFPQDDITWFLMEERS